MIFIVIINMYKWKKIYWVIFYVDKNYVHGKFLSKGLCTPGILKLNIHECGMCPVVVAHVIMSRDYKWGEIWY